MSKKSTITRVLAILLSLCMVLIPCFNMAVFADEETAEEVVAEELDEVLEEVPEEEIEEVPEEVLEEEVPEEKAVEEVPNDALADNAVAFHRMESTAELLAKGHYIIIYHDEEFAGGNVHALSTAADTYRTDIAMSKDVYDSGKGWNVDLNNDSVLTLSLSSAGAINMTANDGQKLKIGTDSTAEGLKVMFDSKAGGITFTQTAELWSVANSSRYLRYIDDAFVVNKSNKAEFEVWTDAVNDTQPEEPDPDPDDDEYGDIYYRLTNLAQLEKAPRFLMVVTDPADGKDKLIGYNPEGGILVDMGGLYNSVGDYISAPDKATIFSHGDVQDQSSIQTWYKYSYIKLTTDTGIVRYWYPKSGDSVNSFLRGSSSNVRFEYGEADESGYRAIYLRGNGDSLWLGVNDSDSFALVTKDSDKKVPVRLYAPSAADDGTHITVKRYDDSGVVSASSVTDPTSYELPRLADIEVENGKKVPAKTKESKTYTFLGWSYEKHEPFLDRDASCNLFDSWTAEDGSEVTGYTDTAASDYSLLGSGNPDKTDVVDLTPYVAAGAGEISLYPIYAMRGIDTVVTTKNESYVSARAADDDYSNAIVGISDWKELQPAGSSYKDMTKEKWLGSIKIEVYKDGVQWGDTETLYFSYHNDNAADLNLKFIDADQVGNYTKQAFLDSHPDYPEAYKEYLSEDDMYWFLSDTSTFPLHDQTGHYTIAAVIADQGGSEESLQYSLNWMTNHGGQLDNVVGGSTVKVYVTTLYDVKYYLDDGEGYQLIEDPNWTDTETYNTPGTKNAFDAAITAFNQDTEHKYYPVTDDNENKDLLDPDVTTGNFQGDGVSDQRGGYAHFSYYFNGSKDYFSTFKSPEELLTGGKKLTTGYWSLRDAAGVERAKIDWNDTYYIKGTAYGTENTIYAYKDEEGGYEAESPYTFHLYAQPTGSLTISKVVEGDLGDKEKAFPFTITLTDADGKPVTGAFWLVDPQIPDDRSFNVLFVNGVATINLKHGQSRTIIDIPVGFNYKVEEGDNEGYVVTATGDTGVIVMEGCTAAFSNKMSAPPAKPAPEVPKTGDHNMLGLWFALLMLSGAGFAFTMMAPNKQESK